VIAGLLLAASGAALSFDGIALGDDAAAIGKAHAALSTFTALGPAWSWRRAGGGTMMISSDATGKVALVDFVADEGEEDAVALPVAGAFDVRATHTALETALGAQPVQTCMPAFSDGYCGAFALRGGSELVAQFETNDGQLHRATWSSAAALRRLHVLPAATPPA